VNPGAVAPALAIASGGALLLSHPPGRLWPLTFVAPALLVAALWSGAKVPTRRPVVRAAVLGGLAGLTLYGPMLSWLILPAGVLGWALLAGIQAAWMALLAVLLRPWLDRWWLPLVAAALWTGVDAWRAVVPLNGFEWGAIAYAHVDGSWLLPVARLVGGRGITFLVVLIGTAAAVVVRTNWHAVRTRGEVAMEDALGSARGPVALLLGGLLLSVLATIEPPPETGTLDVLVVQGNDVRHWEEGVVDPDPPLRITTTLRDLTLAAIDPDDPPDLTVWPESSIDREPTRDRGLQLAELAGEAAEVAGTLLSGASLDGPDPATQREIAALLLQDGFVETDRYVKRRLVPFGEFVPFRPLVDWFPPLEQIPRDAVPSPAPNTISLPDGREVAVVICFESLFTDIVRSNVLAGDPPAQLVLTLTNDASFGESSEPAQHLAQSQLRAVETGRWVVHAALTGSSAFVAPDGEVSQATDIFELATIRMDVPLVEGLTPYLVIGDVVGWVTRALTVAAAVWLVLVWWRRSRVTEERVGAAHRDR
jgi:apolipoprotein N-acyltransferase